MAITYSNPSVIGNSGLPPDSLGHNATWPEGLCRDSSDNIYEVRGWDECHYDINKRDKNTGKIIFNSEQVISGSDMHGIAVESDGSYAYTTNAGGNRSNGEAFAYIYRINLGPGIGREQRREDFSSAGNHITVYNSIPPSDSEFEPLHSIVVVGGSLWVTDAKGGRLIKYDKVSGVQQQVITGLVNAQGLTVDGAGNLWVGSHSNWVSCYNSAGTFIDFTAVSGISQIVALSMVGSVMAVAGRTEGVRTYQSAAGKLTTQLSTYGQPFRAGDGAPDRLYDLHGLVQLSDGSIVFSDRIGFNGRIQKVGGWVQYALEFTSSITFAKEDPSRWISSGRHVYQVAANGSWTFVGNGQTEPFASTILVGGVPVTTSPTSYFGHYTSTHVGPPRLLKLGNNFFLYYPAGNSLGIYRVIDNPGRAPSLQLCSVVGAGKPSPDGTDGEPPYLDENRWSWQWADPVGDGVVRPGDVTVIHAPFADPALYFYVSSITVDNEGSLWCRELDADCCSKIPLDSLNSTGNPVYKIQNRVVVFTRPQIQALLGVSSEVEFQISSRADGDVYALCKVKANPAFPWDDGQWMGGNAIVSFTPAGVPRWWFKPPYWMVGIAAIDLNGGFVLGSNNVPGVGVGSVFHYDKDGQQLHMMRPDTLYGDNPIGPRFPTGSLDSMMSLACQRDPRDGEVKVFASDNLNQRIILYSIKDGLAPVTPPPIEPPPITPPPITPPPVTPPPVIPTSPPDQELIAHVRIWTVPHRARRPAIPKINEPNL